MRSKYDAILAARVAELGRRGFNIEGAARALRISPPTFRAYERQHPEFARAAKAVRRNSQRQERMRVARWLKKTERELLWALAQVRKRRLANVEQIILLRTNEQGQHPIRLSVQSFTRARAQG